MNSKEIEISSKNRKNSIKQRICIMFKKTRNNSIRKSAQISNLNNIQPKTPKIINQKKRYFHRRNNTNLSNENIYSKEITEYIDYKKFNKQKSVIELNTNKKSKFDIRSKYENQMNHSTLNKKKLNDSENNLSRTYLYKKKNDVSKFLPFVNNFYGSSKNKGSDKYIFNDKHFRNKLLPQSEIKKFRFKKSTSQKFYINYENKNEIVLDNNSSYKYNLFENSISNKKIKTETIKEIVENIEEMHFIFVKIYQKIKNMKNS